MFTGPRQLLLRICKRNGKAANSVSRPLGVRTWYRDRYDVVWESGRWRLLSYCGGVFGPDSDTNLTPAEQKTFLTGAGWRRIPAGSG